MLVLLLFHIIITLTSLFTGFLFYSYVARDDNYEKINKFRPVIFYLVTGLIVLTLITQLFILILPATLFYKLSLFILLIISIIITRKKAGPFFNFLINEFKTLHIPVKLVLAATWCLILVLNAGPTMMDDTDSYHTQMVKWIQEYGTVPGLANLHRRFGFNSSWFSSIALFSFEWKNYNFYTALNGILSLWFAGYLLSVAGISPKKNKLNQQFTFTSVYFIVFIIALIAWPVIRGNPATANYDFIALLITFVLFSELLRSLVEIKDFRFSIEWMIWPVFLFTVRITNFPFLLLSAFVFFLLLKQKKWKQIALYCTCCMLLIIPFLIRNIVISGYPFYPSLYFNWFAVDWKADKENTIQLLYYIKYYNRISTGIQDLNATEALAFPDWIFAWFKYMPAYNKILLIPGIAGILLLPVLLRRLRMFSLPAIQIFFIAIIIQIAVWFFSAPDPRFIYGCLFTGILSLLILLKNLLPDIDFRKFYKSSLVLTALIIAVFAFNRAIRFNEYRNWAFPASLPVPKVKNILIDHIELHVPEKILNNWNPRCYATELPCLYEPDTRLQARGKSIADGFKLKK